MKLLCCHEPSKFCFQGALSDQLSVSAWLWDLCCFLIVNTLFSRLRSFSKERGGHPRRSCVGVAARRGNPGQEGRNQGRRANERVSGGAFSFSVSLFSTLLFFVSCSCCFLPMCQAVYLFLSVCITLCVCVSLSVTAFVSLCFGGDMGSRGSDNFLLAPHVCVLVIVCDCAAASLCFTMIPVTWFTDQPCE